MLDSWSMKKFLVTLFLTTMLTTNVLSKEIKLYCKAMSGNESAVLVGGTHSITITGNNKAMIGFSEGFFSTTGNVTDKLDSYVIKGSFPNTQNENIGPYQMLINRVSGHFKLEIIITGSNTFIEQSGQCEKKKFKF